MLGSEWVKIGASSSRSASPEEKKVEAKEDEPVLPREAPHYPFDISKSLNLSRVSPQAPFAAPTGDTPSPPKSDVPGTAEASPHSEGLIPRSFDLDEELVPGDDGNDDGGAAQSDPADKPGSGARASDQGPLAEVKAEEAQGEGQETKAGPSAGGIGAPGAAPCPKEQARGAQLVGEAEGGKMSGGGQCGGLGAGPAARSNRVAVFCTILTTVLTMITLASSYASFFAAKGPDSPSLPELSSRIGALKSLVHKQAASIADFQERLAFLEHETFVVDNCYVEEPSESQKNRYDLLSTRLDLIEDEIGFRLDSQAESISYLDSAVREIQERHAGVCDCDAAAEAKRNAERGDDIGAAIHEAILSAFRSVSDTLGVAGDAAAAQAVRLEESIEKSMKALYETLAKGKSGWKKDWKKQAKKNKGSKA